MLDTAPTPHVTNENSQAKRPERPSIDLSEPYLRLDDISELTLRINRIVGHNLDFVHRKRVQGKHVELRLRLSRGGLFCHWLDFEGTEGENIPLPYGGIMRIVHVDTAHKFVTLSFMSEDDAR